MQGCGHSPAHCHIISGRRRILEEKGPELRTSDSYPWDLGSWGSVGFLVQLEFLNAPDMHAGLPGPQHRLQFARQAGSTAARSAKAPAFHREMGQLERGHPGFLRSSLWSPQGQKVEKHEWACGIEGRSS